MEKVRIGILGAARAAPDSILRPSRAVDGVAVDAVAARAPARARRYAAKHGIPVVHDDYPALLSDPEIDAVYLPVPNSLHAEWSLRALAAGKHVLCEKPFAANAEQAARVADTAAARGLVVTEGVHYRHHPLVRRVLDVIGSGELGPVEHVEASCCLPVLRRDDVVRSYELAGGALMINGCYAVHAMLLFGPGRPEVVAARAGTGPPQVDRSMTVEMRFPSGASGRVRCSIGLARRPSMTVRVVGGRAEARAFGYVVPHMTNRLSVGRGRRWRRERVTGPDPYVSQLRAFAGAITGRTPPPVPPAESVAAMRLIDDAYRAAGLLPRGVVSAS